MNVRPRRISITRRDVLVGAAGSLAGATVSRLAYAEGTSPPSEGFQAALRDIVGNATPEPGLVTLELPEQADNGNIVPYKLAVESEMSEGDYVRKLHLLSTANPVAKVATFHFTPMSGKAAVTGRMRLAKTQDVIAIAEMSTGRMLMGSMRVEVALGGCLN